MRIFVKAKPNSKENKVIEPELKLIPDSEPLYIVHTKEPPREGRANDAIQKLLAEHFKVSRQAVRLIAGATAKRKVFEIK